MAADPRLEGFRSACVRTLVPVLVAAAAAAIANLGLALPPGVLETTLTSIIAAAAGGLYYVGVALLERFKSSRWGVLLGKPGAPVYGVTADRERAPEGRAPEGSASVDAALPVVSPEPEFPVEGNTPAAETPPPPSPLFFRDREGRLTPAPPGSE